MERYETELEESGMTLRQSIKSVESEAWTVLNAADSFVFVVQNLFRITLDKSDLKMRTKKE